MIGSIGVDNRYSTSYNNLKPNRGSDKWANTLVQTIDTDINGGADVNSAKKKYSDGFLFSIIRKWYKYFETGVFRV